MQICYFYVLYREITLREQVASTSTRSAHAAAIEQAVGTQSGAIAFLVSFCQARRTAGQRQTHGRGAWWAKAVPRMESVPITTE
jgi:hypothetical protein